MHRAVLAVAASLVLAHAAAAPLELGRLEDGSILYLASSDGSANLRLVRTHRVFAAPRTVGGTPGVLSEINWQRIDCVARTSEVERIEWYGNAEASGTALREFDLPAALRQKLTVRADDHSAVAVIFNAACFPGGPAAAQPQPILQPQPIQQPIRQPIQQPIRQPASPPPGNANPGPGGFPAGPGHNAPPPSQGPGDGKPPRYPLAPPAPPAPALPPSGAEPIASYRPFPDSVFTLGTMGRLAQYVYYDQEQLAVMDGAADLIARARPGLAPGSAMKGIVETAAARNDKALQRYAAALADKDAMLARESLVSEPLPQLPSKPIAAFRAELYRYQPNGELILVFRGSQEGLDWVSNLWVGIDLLALEAPHYKAARELVERIVKSGRKPVVVGHSLGGGMAQYVGLQFGLKVVGFNSSPLPARYIPARARTAPKNIRLFSAIEYGDQPNQATRADPVSLRLPTLAEKLAAFRGVPSDDNWVKAHQHLVLPVCVASRPQPFRNEEEDEALARLINRTLYPTLLGYMVTGQPMKAAAQQAMQAWIRTEVGRQLSEPVWQPATRTVFDQRVSAYAKDLVGTSAIDAFHAAQGAARMGNVLYNSMFGSMGKAATTMGTSLGVTMAKIEIGMQFMPHSMARFNRGMQAEVDRDVFVAKAVTAQCMPPASTY